jgi:DNA-directed RNA polymerase I subunit RPA49
MPSEYSVRRAGGADVRRVQVIFKSLGCAVDVASVAEREKMGITLQEAQANKRAVLKAPVQFPKTRTRGPVKR